MEVYQIIQEIKDTNKKINNITNRNNYKKIIKLIKYNKNKIDFCKIEIKMNHLI